MLKDYLSRHNKSIYSIAKECGLPYSTLNDFVNGKVRASQCKAGMIHDLSENLGLSMDDLYDMAEKADAEVRNISIMTSYGIAVEISVRHKSYLAGFLYGKEEVMLDLCKVSGPSRFYIEEIAKWRAEEYIRDRRMKEFGMKNRKDTVRG